MEIFEDPQFRQQILDKIVAREFKERTGVHSSDLIYCLNKQALRKLQPIEEDDSLTLLYSLGWSTQRWLTGMSEDEPEREVDGIIVTLDARIWESATSAEDPSLSAAWSIPWELKATFQSSSKPITENVHWIRQIMAQCYVTGSTIAYLSRLEIMGNWKSIFGKKEEKELDLPENRKPTLTAYRLEFTQEELNQNWGWLKQRRDKHLKILETGVLLPKVEALASGQEFECSRCPYKEQCENHQNPPD